MNVKLKDGVYGFIWESGDVGEIFTEPLSDKDIKLIYRVLNDNYMLVVDEEDIKDCFLGSYDDDMDEAYFQITKGGLREVSIVMQPNNLDAEISKLECFRADGSLDLKLIEKALRDAKLSRKDATTASSIFKQILETRDEPKVIFENTPIQSESDAVVNQEEELLKAFEQRELLKHLNNRLKG